MLPVTNGNSTDVAPQGGVNQTPDQIDNSGNIREGMSDRGNNFINRSNMSLTEPLGSLTTETFSNIF